jgi:ABC-type transport system involved in cytochrome c biogenesis permease component|tara:strand:+ start:146 stop:787 length:642 start_codon:yes stop_codon:yes gene_type:complete
MSHFQLFFKRDMKQVFFNPRLLVLPLGFFAVSFFLLHFIAPLNSTTEHTTALYWVIFILSTTGVLGQNIAQDYDGGFLQSLQSERTSLKSYIISKALSLMIGWTFSFWIFFMGLQGLASEINAPIALQSFVTIASLAGALSFLYCLFDTLFLKAKRSPLLSLILLVPFILPLLILSLLSLEQKEFMVLLPTLGYALFLALGSFFLTQKSLSTP